MFMFLVYTVQIIKMQQLKDPLLLKGEVQRFVNGEELF